MASCYGLGIRSLTLTYRFIEPISHNRPHSSCFDTQPERQARRRLGGDCVQLFTIRTTKNQRRPISVPRSELGVNAVADSFAKFLELREKSGYRQHRQLGVACGGI